MVQSAGHTNIFFITKHPEQLIVGYNTIQILRRARQVVSYLQQDMIRNLLTASYFGYCS